MQNTIQGSLTAPRVLLLPEAQQQIALNKPPNPGKSAPKGPKGTLDCSRWCLTWRPEKEEYEYDYWLVPKLRGRPAGFASTLRASAGCLQRLPRIGHQWPHHLACPFCSRNSTPSIQSQSIRFPIIFTHQDSSTSDCASFSFFFFVSFTFAALTLVPPFISSSPLSPLPPLCVAALRFVLLFPRGARDRLRHHQLPFPPNTSRSTALRDFDGTLL